MVAEWQCLAYGGLGLLGPTTGQVLSQVESGGGGRKYRWSFDSTHLAFHEVCVRCYAPERVRVWKVGSEAATTIVQTHYDNLELHLLGWQPAP